MSGLRDLERLLGNVVVDCVNAVASVVRFVDYIADFELDGGGDWVTEAFLDAEIRV